MTRIGIATPASLAPGTTSLPARPDLFPQWLRLPDKRERWDAVAGSARELASRGVEPMIYFETAGPERDWSRWGYPAIDRGDLDERIHDMFEGMPDNIIVRIDQEMNGRPGGHGAGAWRQATPDEYVVAWSRITNLIRTAVPTARFLWSPVLRRGEHMQSAYLYYPRRNVDFTGFTSYSRNHPDDDLRRMRRAIRDFEGYGLPVIVSETGRARGSGGRFPFVRGLRNLPAYGVVYLDLWPEGEPKENDWRLTRLQRAAYLGGAVPIRLLRRRRRNR